jgi:hypothetical protein
MLLFISSCLAAAPIEVDDQTIHSKLSKLPLTFLLAHRPNVTFCEEFLPEFRELCDRVGSRAQCAILNYEKSQKTRADHGIFAYPSIFVFRGIERTAEYSYDRNIPEMLAYLNRISGPVIDVLETARDVFDYLGNHRSCVILAGETLEPDLEHTFMNVATMLRDLLPFAIAGTTDAIQQLGIEEVPALQLHRSEDRQVLEFPLAFSATEEILKGWILENRLGRWRAKDGIVCRDLAFDTRFTLMAFVDQSNKRSLDLMHETFERVVEAFGQNLTYVYCDVYSVGNTLLTLGFTGKTEPLYLITSFRSGDIGESYLFPEKKQPKPENIVTWVTGFFGQGAQSMIKSEPRREGQEGPFFKLVGTDFRAVVGAPEVDVVTALLIGPPDLRNATFKTVKQVAIEFQRQGVESVHFYHIDPQLNDLPGLKTGGWKTPVILLWPAGEQKSPLLFQGNVGPIDLMGLIQSYSKSNPRIVLPQEGPANEEL